MRRESLEYYNLGKGFFDREFDHLDDKTAHKLIVLMARISEKSYRRGFQQGYEGTHPVTVNVADWRFDRSPDKCPSPHGYGTDTAIERLLIENYRLLSAVALARKGDAI